jgi:hypothetical protein
MSYVGHLAEMGVGISGRAITATLYVSPDGAGTNGKTLAGAYTTIQAALDAASTDANDCTQIVIAPHTMYDINTTGNPTWTGNYELLGTHRLWQPIRNTGTGATCVMKFTGKVSLVNMAIFQTGTVDGIIMTGNGYRIRQCGFNSEGITGAATSIYIDGSLGITRGGIIEDIQILGNATYTKGLHINTSKVNEFRHMHIHKCLTGIQIEGATSDYNTFHDIDIGDCDNASGVAIDIDAGNEHLFDHVDFHHNKRNIDDEVGDSIWTAIHGNFPIYIYPDNFTGITVASHVDAGEWGTLADIVAANAIDNPFRIVGVHFKPAVSQLSRVRFTADNGTVYYDDLYFDGDKREQGAAPSGTEFIFNVNTRIEAQAKVVGGGPDNIVVWVEIQEI